MPQPELSREQSGTSEEDVQLILARMRQDAAKSRRPKLRVLGAGVVHVDPLQLFLSQNVEQRSRQFKHLLPADHEKA